MVATDSDENPEDLFSRLVEIPYLTDLTLATRGRITGVPKHIGELLEDD